MKVLIFCDEPWLPDKLLTGEHFRSYPVINLFKSGELFRTRFKSRKIQKFLLGSWDFNPIKGNILMGLFILISFSVRRKLSSNVQGL